MGGKRVTVFRRLAILASLACSLWAGLPRPALSLEPCVIHLLRGLPPSSQVRLTERDGSTFIARIGLVAPGDTLLELQSADVRAHPAVRLADVTRVDVVRPGRVRPGLVLLGVAVGVVGAVLVVRNVQGDNGWTDPAIYLPLIGTPTAAGILAAVLSKRIPRNQQLVCGAKE